jgi:hypothetical protein
MNDLPPMLRADAQDAAQAAQALTGLRWVTGQGWERWDGQAWVPVEKRAVREVIAGQLAGRVSAARLTRVERGCRELLRHTPPQWWAWAS